MDIKKNNGPQKVFHLCILYLMELILWNILQW